MNKKNSNSFYNHKDCSPEQTIKKIRSILYDIDIVLNEVCWNSVAKCCHSVRLIDSNIQADNDTIGTNGKGVTKLFALASAYAEFMERLQNEAIYMRRYGLMSEDEFYFPDETKRKGQNILEREVHIFKNIAEEEKQFLLDYFGDEFNCVPYYHVNSNRIEYLPNKVLGMLSGSNGMCAGNTPEEAILQGLCEICERYSLRQIYFASDDYPTIPLSQIHNLDIFSIIKYFQDLGYTFELKDCSLNGWLPVIGVMIFNESMTKYKVNLGADPTFGVALQRCLTEMNQGIQIKEHLIDFDPILEFSDSLKNMEFRKSFKNYEGQFPFSFIFSEKQSFGIGGFEPQFKNNRTSLRWLIKRIIDAGYNIFIRDVSFLGFPSYHIYIPGMSDVGNIDQQSLISQKHIKKTILNLRAASNENLINCIPIFSGLLNTKHPTKSLLDSLDILIDNSNDLFDLDIAYLLTLICLKIGDYENSLKYLHYYFEQNQREAENSRYIMCSLSYLKLRLKNNNLQQIKNSLVDLFGSKIVDEVIEDFSDPTKTFKYINLPICGDCVKCPTSDTCYYDQYKDSRENVKKQMKKNWIEQSRIGEIIL